MNQDVPARIPWASDALDKEPDAVNLWIGNDMSVTSVHCDPYENIYTVIKGEKHFTLFPPTEGWCLEERTYPHAKYARNKTSSLLEIVPSSCPPIRWSSIDDPSNRYNVPSEAHPLHISLKAGDTLYLPAGWWHHVRQTNLTIALNWWYDAEVRGTNWIWLNLMRGETCDLRNGNET